MSRDPKRPDRRAIGLAEIGARAGQGEVPAEGRLRKRHGGFAAHLDAIDGAARAPADIRLVDPGDCRPWALHNRRYDLLTPERCADLIEGFEAQGRQEFPAIVRALPPGGSHRYEIICGARRHWTASHLNRQGKGPYRFLIEIRDLDDEAAFRLADIENRDRADLSDYERAVDYLGALERYYDGNLTRMAARLDVTREWLSKHIQLARTPAAIVAAFDDPTTMTERGMRGLRAAMKSRKAAVMAEAGAIAREQAARRAAGQGPIAAATVIARLRGTAEKKAPPARPRRITDEGGRLMVERRDTASGDRILRIPASIDLDDGALDEAIRRALDP